jgi:hypothetical protein
MAALHSNLYIFEKYQNSIYFKTMYQKLFTLIFFLVFILKGNCQVNTHKYFPIKEEKITNHELAEILGNCDLISSKINDNYECRVFSVFTGPSDPGYEGCNKSCYYYISNGKYDLPEKYNLFKIGPFYEPINAELIPDDAKNRFKFIIHHIKNDAELSSTYSINFDDITRIK